LRRMKSTAGVKKPWTALHSAGIASSSIVFARSGRGFGGEGEVREAEHTPGAEMVAWYGGEGEGTAGGIFKEGRVRWASFVHMWREQAWREQADK
jgi:hypothetical protein